MSDPRRPRPPSVSPGAKGRPTAPRPAPSAPVSTTPDRPRSTSVAVRTRPSSAGRPTTGRSATSRGAAAPETPRTGRLRQWSRRLSRGDSTTPATTASAPRRTVGDTTIATPWARMSARLSPDTVTQRFQERLRERRTADRRLALIRWAKRLGVVAAAGAAGWILLMSPLFAFDPADVEATGYGTVVDPADVDTILADYDGDSLAMMNTSHVENQLTELVGVASAQVERVWPQGLRVTLAPSEPVAAIPAEGDGYVLVNEDGEPVSESDEAPVDLPVITIPVGEQHARILAGVLQVVDEIPVDLRASVEGIEAQTEDSIHFTLRDGPAVEWGSGEDSDLKAEVLEVLLTADDASHAEVIDVSAPTLPITR